MSNTSKITSAVCKQFLVSCFKEHAALRKYWELDEDADRQAQVLEPKNWKMFFQRLPSNSDIPTCGLYRVITPGCELDPYGGSALREPQENFVRERAFECTPTDGAVAYLVLERANGELVLGQSLGD